MKWEPLDAIMAAIVVGVVAVIVFPLVAAVVESRTISQRDGFLPLPAVSGAASGDRMKT